MRIWRLLVEVGPEVWTYIVAAHDHLQAWNLVIEALPGKDRKAASLEELEATAERRPGTRPRLVHAWRTAPRRELKGSSGTA